MRLSVPLVSALGGVLAVAGLMAVRTSAESADFGLFVAAAAALPTPSTVWLHSSARRKRRSARTTAPTTCRRSRWPTGLHVSLVSSSVASAADQIALWPDDEHPKYLFVCDEETSNPAVQRVDLSKPPASNATTIVTGLVVVRSGPADAVGHHHRRRGSGRDGRPVRNPRSRQHHDADQRDRSRRRARRAIRCTSSSGRPSAACRSRASPSSRTAR